MAAEIVFLIERVIATRTRDGDARRWGLCVCCGTIAEITDARELQDYAAAQPCAACREDDDLRRAELGEKTDQQEWADTLQRDEWSLAIGRWTDGG